MIRENARDIVAQILVVAGYEVEENDQTDLSAFQGDDCIVVVCSDDVSETEAFVRKKYTVKTSAGDSVECVKLLVSMHPPQELHNSVCWGQSEICEWAGKAALAKMLGKTLDLRPALTAEKPRDSGVKPSMQISLDQGSMLPHVPLQVTSAQACQLAGSEGDTICRFLPFWKYTYISTGEKWLKKNHLSFEAEGCGSINAITGDKHEASLSEYVTAPVPADASVLKPKMKKEEAEQVIRGEVKEELTRKVRLSESEGDAIFYQDVDVGPDDKDIAVEATLVYVPIWKVKGSRFVTEINAFTGEILEEPMDDGVEVF